MPLFASSNRRAAGAVWEFGRSTMGVLFSGADKNRAPGNEDAYRAWLISRKQSPTVYHSGEMQLKRLRVLARKFRSRVSAALTVIHQAIIAAKLRRVQRELMFHTKELRDFPQRPLILDDKWDS
jgi:hypothetical protein